MLCLLAATVPSPAAFQGTDKHQVVHLRGLSLTAAEAELLSVPGRHVLDTDGGDGGDGGGGDGGGDEAGNILTAVHLTARLP